MGFLSSTFSKLSKHRFLLEELVKRDFKKKYKRTVLGMAWSMLSPMLMLLVMKVVFENFFGRDIPHYTTYLFCGLLTFNWFAESTNGGMFSLSANSAIFTKVDVPKYLFLFSVNVQALINFALTLLVFFDPYCEHCEKMLPQIKDQTAKVPAEAMAVVYVNTNGNDDVEKAYYLPALPSLYLLDAEKRVLIKDGSLELIMRALQQKE